MEVLPVYYTMRPGAQPGGGEGEAEVLPEAPASFWWRLASADREAGIRPLHLIFTYLRHAKVCVATWSRPC